MFSLQEANFASKLLRKGQSHIFLHFEALVHHLRSFLFSFTVLLRFSIVPEVAQRPETLPRLVLSSLPALGLSSCIHQQLILVFHDSHPHVHCCAPG